MKEVWKDIKDYEGLYQVSNWGRVKSLNYNRTGKAEVMIPRKTKKGYLLVQLSKNGKKKTCSVHRLVAGAFLDNPEGKPEINHIDENKENNRVDNLEWIWHKDNCNHGTRNERMTKTKSKPILQLSLTGDLIKEWDSTQECGRNGFSQGNVSECCNGKRKSHKGFIWKYS